MNTFYENTIVFPKTCVEIGRVPLIVSYYSTHRPYSHDSCSCASSVMMG